MLSNSFGLYSLNASEEVKSLSHVRLFEAPWTVAYQAPQSVGFSRQEYWSGLPFPSPEDLPHPGIEPRSPTVEADTLLSEPPGKSMVRDHHWCVFCLLGWEFWFDFFFFSHSPPIMTVAWLLFARPALVRVLVHVSIKGERFILKENKKSMMAAGDFSHRTRGTAWVVPCTTFCFYFWLVISSSFQQHHCARY